MTSLNECHIFSVLEFKIEKIGVRLHTKEVWTFWKLMHSSQETEDVLSRSIYCHLMHQELLSHSPFDAALKIVIPQWWQQRCRINHLCKCISQCGRTARQGCDVMCAAHNRAAHCAREDVAPDSDTAVLLVTLLLIAKRWLFFWDNTVMGCYDAVVSFSVNK